MKRLHPWALMAQMPTNVLDASGLRVARCDFDGDIDAPEAIENAAFIVHACNAHSELVAALDALLRVDVASEGGLYCADRSEVQDRARTALAKVQPPNSYTRTPQQEQELDVLRSRGEL